jgi:hypothetical protein
MADDVTRMHKTSELPVLADEAVIPAENRRQVLLAEYAEAAAAWRMLTDVRFKLLGLVPAVSALGLTGVVSTKGPLEGTATAVRVAAAVFGFLVVLALWMYDTRNSELYDDLISRGRRTEQELGIHTGVFRGRLAPRRNLVSHGPALTLVYGVVLAAWALAGVAAAFGLGGG